MKGADEFFGFTFFIKFSDFKVDSLSANAFIQAENGGSNRVCVEQPSLMTLVSEELAGAPLLLKSSTIKGLEVIDDAPYAASETTFYFRRIVC